MSDEREALAALRGDVLCPSCERPAMRYVLGQDSGAVYDEGCFVWVGQSWFRGATEVYWCQRCSDQRQAEAVRYARKRPGRRARWK